MLFAIARVIIGSGKREGGNLPLGWGFHIQHVHSHLSSPLFLVYTYLVYLILSANTHFSSFPVIVNLTNNNNNQLKIFPGFLDPLTT